MFDKLGKKARILSQVAFWIRTIFSFALGVVFYKGGKQLGQNYITAQYSKIAYIAAIISLIIGPIAAWLKSAFYYAAGEMLENSDAQTEIMKRLYRDKKRDQKRESIF